MTACYSVEAKWVEPQPGLRLVRTPVGDSASEAMEALFVVESPALLLSTGFCGGLRPDLRAGDLVLADVIRYRGEEIFVSPDLLQRARRALGADSRVARIGPCESTTVVVDAERKRQLAEAGAVSVDMESGSLAGWARRRRIPFLSLRIVLDPLDVDLPFSVEDSLTASILRHPIRTLRVAGSAVRVGRELGRALNELIPVLKENP